MSERHHQQPEQHHFSPEVEPIHAEKPKTAEHHRHAEHKAQPPVEQLEHKAKAEAVVGQELSVSEQKTDNDSPLYVNRELKQETWNRTLSHVRKQLSAPNRLLSKAIHQPVVDGLSRAGAQTVARPSGLLMGGICAFLGSSFFLLMAKRYGFTYNYLVFLLFFAGGFAVGLIIELLVFVVRRKHT